MTPGALSSTSKQENKQGMTSPYSMWCNMNYYFSISSGSNSELKEQLSLVSIETWKFAVAYCAYKYSSHTCRTKRELCPPKETLDGNKYGPNIKIIQAVHEWWCA